MQHPFESHRKDSHEEPWLISYADMMTLLFGFFVLMYVFAQQGKDTSSIRENLSKYFGGEYAEETSFTKVVEEFKSKMGESEILKDIEVKISPEGAEFTFRSTVLFATAKADILPKAKSALEVLISLLSENLKEVGVVVEGHTDDRKISLPPFYSNWELSGARASSVLRLFEKFGFQRKYLLAKAFADTQPAYPVDELTGKELDLNRAKNRRVVIHIFKAGSWTASGKR